MEEESNESYLTEAIAVNAILGVVSLDPAMPLFHFDLDLTGFEARNEFVVL